MRADEVRRWLGLFFLLLTIVLGGYILLFSETFLLPVSKQEGTDAFEIIVPVLVGQLTIIFQWFANPVPKPERKIVSIEPWIVKAPPIGVGVLMAITLVMMAVGNSGTGRTWTPSPAAFKGVVTFAVSILNATTFLIISRYFRSGGGAHVVEAAPATTPT